MSADRADAFAALRPHLVSVAYATLGSVAEAEDVAQECWLRLARTAPGEIADLRAWCTTVVGRLALDVLGSARARRERYVGPWLPEPLVDAHPGPAEDAERAEEVSLALLRVLEALSPAERTAWVLHDIFGLPFGEVADVVGRRPEAVRQLAARARRHVRDGRPRFPATPTEQEAVVVAFAAAAAGGDLPSLVALLDPRVTMRSDGGGVVSASRKPLVGADRVARAIVALARHQAGALRGAVVSVNGAPGLLTESDGERTVTAFTLDGGRVVALDVMRNPEKLGHVPALESLA